MPLSVGEYRGVHLLGNLIDRCRRAPEWEHLSPQELCYGNLEGAPFLGIQKNMGRRAQGMGMTLHGGPAGEPERGLVYRGLICRRLWRQASLSIGALLGNLEGGLYNGDFER